MIEATRGRSDVHGTSVRAKDVRRGGTALTLTGGGVCTAGNYDLLMAIQKSNQSLCLIPEQKVFHPENMSRTFQALPLYYVVGQEDVFVMHAAREGRPLKVMAID